MYIDERLLKILETHKGETIDVNFMISLIKTIAEEHETEQLRIGGVVSSLNKICDEHNLDIEDVLLEYDKKLNGFDVYYDEGIEVSYLVRKGFIQL
jgi:hypothetical protein